MTLSPAEATALRGAAHDYDARQAETPDQRQARQDAEARARAEELAARLGVPFDRYAHEHRQWRQKIDTAGRELLQAVLGDPDDVVLDSLMVGGMVLPGPWRAYQNPAATGGERVWVDTIGRLVAEDQVQFRQVRRYGPASLTADTHPDADAWRAYAALLEAEPAPDCDGSGYTLDPDDDDDQHAIDTERGWCPECESTVPVIAGDTDADGISGGHVLALHDRKGRPVT